MFDVLNNFLWLVPHQGEEEEKHRKNALLFHVTPSLTAIIKKTQKIKGLTAKKHVRDFLIYVCNF